MERRTVQFQARTRNLFLHVLTRCNLRCRHCYINPGQHGTGVLDAPTMARWLALFAEGAEVTNVVFLGGEPTLNPALPDGIREARRLGYASVTVDTNGFLFHDVLDRVAPDEVDYFSFSLDGASPEVNDPVRGAGVFETCTAGIRRARERGFGVSVIFTASRLNLHDLPNMPGLLAGLGVERFFIQVIGIRGQPAARGEAGLQLAREEWEAVVPGVARAAARLGLVVTYPKVFLAPGEPFACAGRVADNYFVFPNGRVYRCPLCEDFPLHSLEIRGDRLVERPPIRESDLFGLEIPEGCVLNRILHPGNLAYDAEGRPLHRIACCMLKEEVRPAGPRRPRGA
ncbi:radical SAM protein [Dissulfurirhabdus thermomarina]|uniref:Radical SAM protein n=1 Tax=Dissulfurirhabdus thermomarina TaxID=1765737 RepID=A0A6N9TTY6_DISTH|nr:radical SAM protein [Dissulfurirhabdus thermomarina]NMX22811.1 radical SAM protein [Dissulfurirhabdus thermomarina]